TDESAKVEVWRDDELIGSASYTIDQAKTAGLAGKDNWRKNPGDMLVARATTRAIKRHAPAVLLGLLVGDEAEQVDPVSHLTPTPAAPAEETPTPDPGPVADIVDAEVIESPADPELEPIDAEAAEIVTADTLKARI